MAGLKPWAEKFVEVAKAHARLGGRNHL
jgi:hypothetical protein